jgi:hypothetical protein
MTRVPASRFQLFPENVNNFHPANNGAWLAASNSPGQSSPFRKHFLSLEAHSMIAVAWVLARARPAPLFLPWNYFSFYLFTFLPPQHSL